MKVGVREDAHFFLSPLESLIWGQKERESLFCDSLLVIFECNFFI